LLAISKIDNFFIWYNFQLYKIFFYSRDIAGGECGAFVLSLLGVCPLWGEITIEKGGG
jgi:hypothetical protein